MGSFSGTCAGVASIEGLKLARSSFSAREEDIPEGAVGELTMNGLHPRATSRKSSTRALSEPLASSVELVYAAALAGVFWARVPLPRSR